MTLSSHTQKKINWQRIEDSAIGISMRGGEPDRVNTTGGPSAATDVMPIFATARQEFQRALTSLRFTTHVFVLVAGLSAAACIGGVVVAAAWKQIIGGSIFTGAGTAALLALFAKIQAIGRDQAMLELVPTKYELALQFAVTPEDRRTVLNRFLEEVSSLKSS